MAGSILGFSLPTFWVGLMLQLVFAIGLGWLPSSGRAPEGSGLARMQYLVLPAAVLAVHLKARFRDRVASELMALGLDRVRLAEPGREYIW